MNMAVMSASIASEMLSAPARPRPSSTSCVRIAARILFMRSSSPSTKTTYGEPLSLISMRIAIIWKSSRRAVIAPLPSRMDVCSAPTFSSLEAPPPPPPPPEIERIVKKRLSHRLLSSEISAFGCMPKSSGDSGGDASST